MQPDGYVDVLFNSPAAMSELDPVDPQPQVDGCVQLSAATSDSPTSVLDCSKQRFGNKEEEPCCAEVSVAEEYKCAIINADPVSLQAVYPLRNHLLGHDASFGVNRMLLRQS